MSGDAPSIPRDASWSRILDLVKGRTVMVIGGTGTGKTRLAAYLVERLAEPGEPVGLVSADMGQPSVGVPTCLALSMTGPQGPPSAMWFIGDVTPLGNLLPTVVGTSRLVVRARTQGARTVVIDTTGLVEGAVARALKYHKALASGVDCVLAIQRAGGLEEMLALLAAVCPNVHRLQPAPQAEDRSRPERRAYREARYEGHFGDGEVRRVDRGVLIRPDWSPVPFPGGDQPAAGTVVGLLDREGFCLGLGIVEEAQAGQLLVYTPLKDLRPVAKVQAGRVRLDRHAGFLEVR